MLPFNTLYALASKGHNIGAQKTNDTASAPTGGGTEAKALMQQWGLTYPYEVDLG